MISLAALILAVPLAPAPQEVLPADTALVVDGEAVPWADFAAWILEQSGPELVQDFVHEAVLVQRAEALGVAPTEEEVLAQVDADIALRIDLAFGGDAARHAAELEAIGSSLQEDRERRQRLVAARLLRDGLARALRPPPTEDAARELHRRRYGVDARELEVSAIRLRPPSPAPIPGESSANREARARAARREILDRLGALAERVRQGENVADLARAESQDPESATRGGRLAAPFERHRWPAPVAAALAEVSVGDPAPPVFAHGYFNLFVVTAARPVPFEAQRGALLTELAASEPDEEERVTAAAQVFLEAEPQLEWFALTDEDELTDENEPTDENEENLSLAVARLGEHAWIRDDLARWIAADRVQDLARRFVRDHRLARRAHAIGAAPTRKAIEARAQGTLARTLNQVFGGDPDRMRRDLDRRGITETRLVERFRREAERDLQANGVLRAARSVTDEDVRAEWERRHGPLGLALDARFLVRRLAANRDPAAEEQRLEGLAQKARAGADFGALVERWSDDPITREYAGRRVAPGERWVHEDASPLLLAALEKLEAGELAGPLLVGGELVLVQLTARTRTRLGDVADKLRAELEAREPTPADRAALLVELERAPGWRVVSVPR